jgi:hypothetical protein
LLAELRSWDKRLAMGYHAGIIAARASWAALESRLVERTRLKLGAPIKSIDDVDDRDQGIGGELDGRAYVHDAEMLLSGEGDLIVALSKDLDTLVVGCGAETVSGSFWLFAAERGELLRTYWACAMEMDKPLDVGTWPPGERIELEDLDGCGIRDALAADGFDFDAFIEHGSKRCITLPDDYELGEGPIAAQIDAHRQAHKIPEGQQPKPQLVVRSFEGGTGFDIAAGPEPRPGLFSRVRSWFSGR